jgi:hypothetical protein
LLGREFVRREQRLSNHPRKRPKFQMDRLDADIAATLCLFVHDV